MRKKLLELEALLTGKNVSFIILCISKYWLTPTKANLIRLNNIKTETLFSGLPSALGEFIIIVNKNLGIIKRDKIMQLSVEKSVS